MATGSPVHELGEFLVLDITTCKPGDSSGKSNELPLATMSALMPGRLTWLLAKGNYFVSMSSF